MEGSTKKYKTGEDVNNFLNEVAGNQFLKLPKVVLIHIILIDKTLKVKDIIKMGTLNVYFKNLTEHEYSDEEGERWRGIFEILFIRRYGKPELDRVKLLETNGPVKMSQRYLIMLMIDFMFTKKGINHKNIPFGNLYQKDSFFCLRVPGIFLKDEDEDEEKWILKTLQIILERRVGLIKDKILIFFSSAYIDEDILTIIRNTVDVNNTKTRMRGSSSLQVSIDTNFFKEHPTFIFDIIYKIYSYYLSQKKYVLKNSVGNINFQLYLNDIQSQYCENCFEKTATLMCSSCENVSYCSQRCGEKNWKQIHQHVCN
jgi:hypothetical protein